MAEAILTRARRSVWLAIDHWPALEGALTRVWRFDDAGAMQAEPTPSLGDLPALAIYPASSPASDWFVSQAQMFPYSLEASLWTRHWSLGAGERLWEEINRAVLQSAPTGQPTYLFSGTGFNDAAFGSLTVRRSRLADDGPVCTLWNWTIGLRIKWNPAL